MTNSRLKILGWVGSGVVGGLLLSLGLSAVAQRPGSLALPIDELRQFAEVYGAIKGNYVEEVEDKRLITEAISGMLSGLDPHSTYLDAEAFKEMREGTQGEFGGLGIEVGMEDGFVRVVSPIEDTPAYRAGIKSGDLIIKIDDRAVKGLDLSEAVRLMRGKPKTKIRLTVSRKGAGKPLEFVLVRDVIRVQSVKSKLLPSDHLYLRVTQFQEHTVELLASHFDRLLKEAKAKGQTPKGIVLDLRNDPGGLLNAAVGVTAAFVPPGEVVVSTNGRQEDAKRVFKAVPQDYQRSIGDPLAGLSDLARSLPMVVLVNGGSASASEIVAGALQDLGRAKILGTQTFGKGSVQTILPLSSNSAIKLTTARYFTPKGRSIQAKGIRPDFWVEETPDGAGSERLRIREENLNGHLEEKGQASRKPERNKSKESDTPEPAPLAQDAKDKADAKPVEFGSETDHQLLQAVALLESRPVLTTEAPPEPEDKTGKKKR